MNNFIKKAGTTLLCVGPMSKNCIDASIEIAKQFNVPQILIASRRQIDSKFFGGGYVENFTTEEFAKYVRNKNVKNVFLARDHGGPWQSTKEIDQNLNFDEAMASAKKSFETDILSGFDFIHIDPSVPIQKENLNIEIILNRLFELYGHTYEFAKNHSKSIYFELGTEEQNGYYQNLDKFEYFLNECKKFCVKNKIAFPTFVVVQTGTKVMETKNIGIFGENFIEENSLNHLKKSIEICRKYDVLLKEHNTDYLDEKALALRPLLGIDASNVAPEFGVVETKGFLYLLKSFGYIEEFNSFIEAAVSSKKWVKWMLPNSKATDYDKAIICGHYIFSNKKIKQMKDKVASELLSKNIHLDKYLKTLIKQSMLKYMHLFNMI